MARSSGLLLIGHFLLSSSALFNSSFCSHSLRLYSSFLFFLSFVTLSLHIHPPPHPSLSLAHVRVCSLAPGRHVSLICSELEQHCARPFRKSARACASAARSPACTQANTQEEEGQRQEAAAAAFLEANVLFSSAVCLRFTSWFVDLDELASANQTSLANPER